MDALLLAVLDEIVALQNGVTLDLVGGGGDAGGLDEGLDLFSLSILPVCRCMVVGKWNTYVLDCVVGDTDGPGLGLG